MHVSIAKHHVYNLWYRVQHLTWPKSRLVACTNITSPHVHPSDTHCHVHPGRQRLAVSALDSNRHSGRRNHDRQSGFDRRGQDHSRVQGALWHVFASKCRSHAHLIAKTTKWVITFTLLSTQAIRKQLIRQVMRCLGAKKMPSWLMLKLGQYPNLQDYTVVTVDECDIYWKELVPEDPGEQTMSSSFDRLSLASMQVEPTQKGMSATCQHGINHRSFAPMLTVATHSSRPCNGDGRGQSKQQTNRAGHVWTSHDQQIQQPWCHGGAYEPTKRQTLSDAWLGKDGCHNARATVASTVSHQAQSRAIHKQYVYTGWHVIHINPTRQGLYKKILTMLRLYQTGAQLPAKTKVCENKQTQDVDTHHTYIQFQWMSLIHLAFPKHLK